MKNLLLIALFPLVICSACTTFKYTVGTEFTVQSQANAEKSTTKVGYYISPQVANFTAEKPNRQFKTDFDFGPSLCYGFEETLKTIFTETVRLQDTVNIDPDIDLLITADNATGSVILPNELEKIRMLLRVEFTAYDKNGHILWKDTYQGEGVRKWNRNYLATYWCLPIFIFTRWKKGNEDLEECMRATLEDLFRNTCNGMEAGRFWVK